MLWGSSDCFAQETQRMHSHGSKTARNAQRDVVLPGVYLISKGGVVTLSFPACTRTRRTGRIRRV